jgi:hypothetical protein
MKIHKYEVYVLDFESYGPDEYQTMITNKIDFATVFYQGSSKSIKWTDGHELNKKTATNDTWKKYIRDSK